ncbi:hypothetical protein GCM10009718_30000 [Isoptericola halotolerans]|uniref:MFS family arabinose efflux permease n=1 Tax=Isoptericola halotolerans TaxID=300560 RepID=A0ABX2A477_9MICO|nr:hypothetical protein [Isoptericola halotolerans]NOV97660.1 putative MFS family arabinose efflux permease [Isoptericola halotolerans]
MGFSHAIVAAQVTAAIAQRGGDDTVTAFGLNAAGMSAGVFVGALLGGAGLAVAGPAGLAVVLALPVAVAGALVPWATRQVVGAE